jgi:hypothetical protein
MATPARLSALTSIPIVVVSAMALWLSIAVTVGHLERELHKVQESHVRFSLGELRARLQSGLDFDVHFAGAGRAQELLDRAVRVDTRFASISVTDAGGARVFVSGDAKQVPRLSQIEQRMPAFSMREAESLVMSAALHDDSGAHSGAVAVRYNTVEPLAAVSLARRQLALAACAALVVLALCCALGFHALMRHSQRRFDLMASRLGSVRAHGGLDAGILLVEQASMTSKTALHEVNAARDALASREPSR